MRKTVEVVVREKNRDEGKTFLITEMSAYDAESWANRAFLALSEASLDLPPGLEGGGMPAFMEIVRLFGHVRFPTLKPLMDELLDCVAVQPDPTNKAFTRALVRGQAGNDDVEEVSTYQLLRQEVASLHVNFTMAASVLTLIALASNLQLRSEPPSGAT